MAEIGRHTLMREADELGLSGFCYAEVKRCQSQRECRMRPVVLLGDRWIDEVDDVFRRDFDIGIFDIVRSRSAHAEALPVLDDLDARQPVRHHECSHPRRRFVSMRPDKEMRETICARHEAFSARDRPAIVCPAGERRGQATARRRPQLRLDTRGIEQQRPLFGVHQKPPVEIFGPVVFRGLGEMGKDRHGADQRHGRIAPAKCRENVGGIGKRRSLAAITCRNRAFEEAAFVNGTDTRPGKLASLVRIRCGLFKDASGCV